MITFSSPKELAKMLRDVQQLHHEYERTLGGVDKDWATWYANCLDHLTTNRDNIGSHLWTGNIDTEIDLGATSNQLADIPATDHPGTTFIDNYGQGGYIPYSLLPWLVLMGFAATMVLGTLAH